MRRIVVVGASLAGLRAVEALRRAGFDGTLTLVGAESHLPYDRPPLSKQVLVGDWEPERTALADTDQLAKLEVELRLGRRANGLDLSDRTVDVDGEAIAFDGLIIATGAAPRTLPNAARLDGVHTLRTLDDCLAIRAAMEAGARVVVVGAGFIGAEVAACARARGLSVTVIEALDVPLARALGPEIGSVCAAMHRDHGVDLRCGVMVDDFVGSDRVEGVRLAGGEVVPADLVVVGIGVVPCTNWLRGSGLELDDGVVCDETCAAADRVYAAGDVARWHNPLMGESSRVEHWTNAAEQADRAARNLLAGADGAEPYAPVPYFWSDQYDTKIQLVGSVRADDEMRVVRGSIADNRFAALYGRAGRVVGALAFNWPRMVMLNRQLVADGASWDKAIAQGAS